MYRLPKNICPPNSFTKVTAVWIGMIFIIGLILPFTLYFRGFADGQASHFAKTSYIQPTIDGIITVEEWNKADLFMYAKYMRFAGLSDAKTDWNYLCVGQDASTLYIAMDMVSIQNDLPNEMLGIYLITDTKYFNDIQSYMLFQEWGVDAVRYNITGGHIENDTLNTIPNAQCLFQYGSSANSDTIHRMVEITIPIAEVRYYNPKGLLGLLIVGEYDGGVYGFGALTTDEPLIYYKSSNYIGIEMGLEVDITI